MKHPDPPIQGPNPTRLTQVVLLLLWAAALVGYFAPWIDRKPSSAALGWNAYDLFALLRLLPEIESGAVTVNLQTLQLPLLCLAVLLPTLLVRAPLGIRLAAALAGCGFAAITMPPYPQILTAWRTPGWRVPFWWGLGTMALTLAAAWAMPAWARCDRRGFRQWAVISAVELAVIPPIVTLYRLLPALRSLHAAPVTPGWGFWFCSMGLSAIGVVAWYQTLSPVRRYCGEQN